MHLLFCSLASVLLLAGGVAQASLTTDEFNEMVFEAQTTPRFWGRERRVNINELYGEYCVLGCNCHRSFNLKVNSPFKRKDKLDADDWEQEWLDELQSEAEPDPEHCVHSETEKKETCIVPDDDDGFDDGRDASCTGEFEWHFTYNDVLGIPLLFHDEAESKMGPAVNATNDAQLTFTVFEPRRRICGKQLATVFLSHGVPVSKEEWFDVAHLLARFMRVVVVDNLGMGESSAPLNFCNHSPQGGCDINDNSNCEGASGNAFPGGMICADAVNDWYWSWENHAIIYRHFFEALQVAHPDWFVDGKAYFGGNDWGGGIVQAYMNEYAADPMMHAFVLGSPITMDGYWVQQIGAFRAIATLPYFQSVSPADGEPDNSPQIGDFNGNLVDEFFEANAVAFVKDHTELLEQMHHHREILFNQYSFTWLQRQFVEVPEAYYDVNKVPANTNYRFHRVRVHAQEATFILGKGQLLAQTIDNGNGLDYTKFDTPLLVYWGLMDKMMPSIQRHYWCELAQLVRLFNPDSGFTCDSVALENAGHFASSDQPERASEAMLEFFKRYLGPDHFQQPFLGFDEIWRGGEALKKRIFERIANALGA